MRRTASPGWASLVLWILLGLVPVGHPVTSTGTEWSARPSNRSEAPLGSHQAPVREIKVSVQPARHGWPLDAALPAAPPVAVVRLLTVRLPVHGFDRPSHQKRVAFPYFTTGPPVRPS